MCIASWQTGAPTTAHSATAISAQIGLPWHPCCGFRRPCTTWRRKRSTGRTRGRASGRAKMQPQRTTVHAPHTGRCSNKHRKSTANGLPCQTVKKPGKACKFAIWKPRGDNTPFQITCFCSEFKKMKNSPILLHAKPGCSTAWDTAIYLPCFFT